MISQSVNAGRGSNTYKFAAAFAQDVINNEGGNLAPSGEIDFTASSVNSQNLWFTQSGVDLIIQLLGTTDTITVPGWFSIITSAQVLSINTADGGQLANTAVAALVSAMVAYQRANSSFDPSTASAMPTDTSLQNAITAAWGNAAPPTEVTVAYAEANQSSLDAISGGYTVADTAANVTTGLAFLTSDASHIGSITLTDSGTPTLSLAASQYSADTAGLAKITSAYNLSITGVTAANASSVAGAAHVTSLTVSDTAANVVTNIAALETLATGTVLSSIALTDSGTPTLSLTGAQYSADTAALGKITGAYSLSITGVTAANASTIAGASHVTSITVSDTAANVLSRIASLETLATGGKLASIALTDTGTPVISLTGAQMASDAAALGKITTPYNLTLTGGGTATMPGGVAPQSVTLPTSGTAYTLTANATPGLTVNDNNADGNDVINANAGDTVNAGGNGFAGNWDQVYMAGGTVNIGANANVYTEGNNNTITAGNGSEVGVSGTGNTLTASNGDVWFGSNTTLTINGSSNTVWGTTGLTVTLNGGGDTYNDNGHTGESVTVSGNGMNGTTDALNINSGTVQILANARADIDGGSNTITAGASDTIAINGSSNTLTAGSGDSILFGSSSYTGQTVNGGGNEQYNFGTTWGQDTINNGGGSTANGTVAFASGITDQKLWFVKSGNDLLVDLLGTSDQIKIAGWYTSTGNQVQSFAAGGLTLDTQIAALVTAMANYQSAHSSFNPTTASAMPTDTTLQNAITSDWHSGTSTNVTVAYAQANQSTVDAISGGYTVVDTAANVQGGLTFLVSDVAHIAAIQLTDGATPTLSLTATQYSADTAALAKITSAYNLSISGVTAANASSTAGASHVTSITVSDTAASVVTNIAALETLATGTVLSSIALTDSGTPTLSLTASQYSADTAALNKITSAYNLTVSGVTAANASGVAGNGHVTSLTISDTAANVASNIAALETLATGTKLTSITLTDSGTPTLSLTGTQLTNDSPALAKITNAYNLSLTGGGTATMGSGIAGVATVALQSSSSAYTFTANNLTGLVITDSSATNDTLTAGNGGDTLIAGTGSDTMNGGNAATTYKVGASFGQDTINNAAGGSTTAKGEVDFATGTTPQNLWLAQSGNNLVITLLDTADTITLTGWFGSNAGAQVQTFKAGGLQLTNTAVAALVSAMATYRTNNSGFNPNTATSMPTDSTLQAAIATAWPGSLNTSNVTVAYAQANQSALDAHSGGYTVADTAANVTTGLAFLTSDASHIGSITLTDGGTPTLSPTASQYSADTAELAKITSAYNLSISGVTAANASSIAGASHVTSVAVSDTAANIIANVSALKTLVTNGKLLSIILTDSGTPNISLSGSQLASDASVLAKITSAYTLTITGGGTVTMPAGVTPQSVTLASSGSSYTFTANGLSGQTINDNGAAGGDVITGSAGDTVNVGGNGVNGNWDQVYMSNGTVGIGANANVYVSGGSDTITAGTGSEIGIDGTGSTVTASSDDIWFDTGTTATVTGDNDTLWGNNGLNLTINGTGDTFNDNGVAGQTLTVGGNGMNGTSNTLYMANGTVNIQANARADIFGDGETIHAAASDTIGVYGSNDTVTAGSGDSIWMGDSSNTSQTINASSGGNEQYHFDTTWGQDTINNGGGSTANGTASFASGVTDEKLWFAQSGNDLLVELLDTSDRITLAGWYTSGQAGNQVQSFTAGGLTLDTQVAQLVQAMASYQSAHSGFNPTTASAMPTDTTLQNAIAAAWHS